MPALKNPRWEKFAREVAGGKSQRDAYKACGGKALNPDSAASDLAQKPEIEARIKELTRRSTNKAMERCAITKTWVMESLRENAVKAMKSPRGSSIANRALELLGTQLGLFRNDAPPVPLTVDDLTKEQLEQLIENVFGSETLMKLREELEKEPNHGVN
jgi:hypothetical protein